MRLENYETRVLRLLERARDAHRTGKRKHAEHLRGEARALATQGADAIREALNSVARLQTEIDVQAVEDDAYLRRLTAMAGDDTTGEAA